MRGLPASVKKKRDEEAKTSIDPELAKAVRVPQASYGLSSVEMQQIIRRAEGSKEAREFAARARVHIACQYAERQSVHARRCVLTSPPIIAINRFLARERRQADAQPNRFWSTHAD
ncbi:hypothetical protein P9239_13645 [Caballeronia sp. LZ062]|uniref:hypothetical protein n=1 Tax=unclassified Caballeronia TaxID=2646786 RepID=UPI0028568B3A|nr:MULTISPECIES: hypothetical protein [unclassified Caballeronia]MDR5854081.1 hypothetical protein [Caballeronia sp. LZ050]MDR5871388.1 hypothetical protein [Caballeronia sp. LZ062]